MRSGRPAESAPTIPSAQICRNALARVSDCRKPCAQRLVPLHRLAPVRASDPSLVEDGLRFRHQNRSFFVFVRTWTYTSSDARMRSIAAVSLFHLVVSFVSCLRPLEVSE